MIKNCVTCKFSSDATLDKGAPPGLLECRTHPPSICHTLIADDDGADCFAESVWYVTHFPVVDKTDWCGEWAVRIANGG
jgi:hypothetical protein